MDIQRHGSSADCASGVFMLSFHRSFFLYECVVLQPGVSHSALCEAVEAHKLLAVQEGRLELLLQQLADKEALLEQARQLVGTHTMQLQMLSCMMTMIPCSLTTHFINSSSCWRQLASTCHELNKLLHATVHHVNILSEYVGRVCQDMLLLHP